MRTHVSLPEELVAEIDELAGPRGRSKFIEEAVRAKVQHEKLGRALKLLAEMGPLDPNETLFGDDAAAWVHNLRLEDMAIRERRLNLPD